MLRRVCETDMNWRAEARQFPVGVITVQSSYPRGTPVSETIAKNLGLVPMAYLETGCLGFGPVPKAFIETGLAGKVWGLGRSSPFAQIKRRNYIYSASRNRLRNFYLCAPNKCTNIVLLRATNKPSPGQFLGRNLKQIGISRSVGTRNYSSGVGKCWMKYDM